MEFLVVLGATGSIGQQTLEVIQQHSDQFSLLAVSGGDNIEVLLKIIDTMKPPFVCVKNTSDIAKVKALHPKLTVCSGDEGLVQLATLPQATKVVNALVGFVGLQPTLAAIDAGKTIALANKETLVVAGSLVMELAEKKQVSIFPIDSEHSAIFQALQGNRREDVKNLIITASGGSFRDKTRQELKTVTINEALNHPNWQMGAKITIDSATMMNKGFEVIEAHWLFQMPYNQIKVLMHQESIVHSLVEYIDGSIIAQLGNADMRVPIQYALSYPKRYALRHQPFSLADYSSLHFSQPDFKRYPLLALAYKVGEQGGNLPVVMNAANEVAVALFLKGTISFLAIEQLVITACQKIEYVSKVTLDDIIRYDKQARELVYDLAKELV